MGTATYICPLFFSTLCFLWRPTGRKRCGQRVVVSWARRPRYPTPALGPQHAGRGPQNSQVTVDVRDEVVPPGVESGVRARDIVVGHNSLLVCELTSTAASSPNYCRAEWAVSTSSGPRRRVMPPPRVVRGSDRAARGRPRMIPRVPRAIRDVPQPLRGVPRTIRGGTRPLRGVPRTPRRPLRINRSK